MRHYDERVSIRRFLWVLAAVVAVFAVTLVFRPLAPRELLTNPLFAIGFGAPLVLHLGSLNRSRFIDLVPLALAGLAFHDHAILALGITSTILLALRRDLVFLLPSLIALFFTLEVSLFLQIISTYPPLTYDSVLYAADLAYGAPVSFRVGQLFVTYPLIGAICTAIYLAPPPGLIYVYALEARREDRHIDIITTLVAMGAAGYSLYFLVPACGPKFIFATFPAAAVTSHAPRNAMPSLHMASALIAFVHARRFGRIASAVAAIFILGTFLGTMGTGEHYFVDLVVAVPFTAMMHALLERRFARAIAPAVAMFTWLLLLRFDRFAPWMAWPMLAFAVAAAIPFTLRAKPASECAA